MSTLIDNSGSTTVKEAAGRLWVERKFSSYTVIRSQDDQFVVTKTDKGFFTLSWRNQAGEFDTANKSYGFGSAALAMAHALTVEAVAA
jgi:hypothetical protein